MMGLRMLVVAVLVLGFPIHAGGFGVDYRHIHNR